MKKNMIVWSFILLLAGCLRFGEDVELSGEDVNSDILAKVTKLTGVVFPEGTKGKNYLYFGSGIDDALAIKVSIPKEKKEEFLMNEIFKLGMNEEPYIQLGKENDWWKLESLADPVHTLYSFPNGNGIECSVGEESGETIVYLTWITV
ncbi:hypothetical protein ACFLTH_04040 [Bacteroidota bacterium]